MWATNATAERGCTNCKSVCKLINLRCVNYKLKTYDNLIELQEKYQKMAILNL